MAKARRGRRRGTARQSPSAGRSLRAHWRADGTEKTRFPTADAANRATLQARLENGADLDPYPCPYCDGWHLANRDT
jgi:hypothetical protein